MVSCIALTKYVRPHCKKTFTEEMGECNVKYPTSLWNTLILVRVHDSMRNRTLSARSKDHDLPLLSMGHLHVPHLH